MLSSRFSRTEPSPRLLAPPLSQTRSSDAAPLDRWRSCDHFFLSFVRIDGSTAFLFVRRHARLPRSAAVARQPPDDRTQKTRQPAGTPTASVISKTVLPTARRSTACF